MMDFGGKTDEQKMGVTYKEIAEYMKIGKTNKEAEKIIKKMHKASEHKRNSVPTYIRKKNI